MENEFRPDFFGDFPSASAIFKLVYDKTGEKVIDTEYIFVNEKYCQLSGKTKDELIGHSFRATYDNEDVKWFEYCQIADQKQEVLTDHIFSQEIKHWLIFSVGPTSRSGYVCYNFNIIDEQRQKDILKSRVSFTNETVLKISTALNSEKDYETSMNEALTILGNAIQSDRTYVLETDMVTIDNTFEWCNEGITSEIDSLQNVDYDEYMRSWEVFTRDNGLVFMPDLEELRDDYPNDYAILHRQGISSLIAAPMYNKGKLIGYLGADNFVYSDLINTRTILEMAATFISMKISYHRVLLELDYMSHYDVLTGVHNRNALLKKIAALESLEGSAGIVFADLNGLKQINDTFGHSVGDEALRDVANILCKHFGPANVYREGGDEFVVILPMISKMEFSRLQDQIRKNNTTSRGTVIALGFAFEEDIHHIKDSIILADHRMYDDKKDYYTIHDRRKSAN